MNDRLPYRNLEVTTNRHGTPVIYFRQGRGARVRLPDDTRTAAFRKHYFAALAGDPIPYVPTRPPLKADVQKQRTERTLKRALRAARTRSRKRGIVFALNLDWALTTAQQQNFHCILTGLPFYMDDKAPSKVNPFTPSFDRIDCRGGYTPDNVRIVIFAINAMLLDWGEAVFEVVAAGYRAHKRRTKNEHSIPAPRRSSPAPGKI